MEARIEALLDSTGQELRAAEARIREAEQRTQAAEARAQAAQQRLKQAEEWIARLTGAIEENFAGLRAISGDRGSDAGSPPQ